MAKLSKHVGSVPTVHPGKHEAPSTEGMEHMMEPRPTAPACPVGGSAKKGVGGNYHERTSYGTGRTGR